MAQYQAFPAGGVLEIMLAAPGMAWHGLEEPGMSIWLSAYKRIFVCTRNSAWNRHGTAHGMRME